MMNSPAKWNRAADRKSPTVSCTVKSTKRSKYVGKSLDEGYSLIMTKLIWPYERVLRKQRAWRGSMSKLNLPQARWPGAIFR